MQAGIHGNESEGIDASLQIIERLATTPYGTDPEVDTILDNAVVLFNVIQNPDGHIANQRANGNNFDLNRDFLTQSQSETKASVAIMQKWLPPEMLDLHGYVTPTLIEATTKPHNPSIEYDLWLKWNQARIDANEAAMNAIGHGGDAADQRLVPERRPATGLDRPLRGRDPARARRWPRAGTTGARSTRRCTRSTSASTARRSRCATRPARPAASPASTTHPARPRRLRGRRSTRSSWSTLLFDLANRHDLIWDELEIYRPRRRRTPPGRRAARRRSTSRTTGCASTRTAYVIPVGAGQRSDAEANRLVEWLLDNGIEVGQTEARLHLRRADVREGLVRGRDDPGRTAGSRTPRSASATTSPPRSPSSTRRPAAWSHGYLWGADIVTIPRGAGTSSPLNSRVNEAGAPDAVASSRARPTAYVLRDRLARLPFGR